MQAFTAASMYLQSKYLKDCTLYVTLEPCTMCMGAAYWTQIDKIVFGAYDKRFAHIDKKSLFHPTTQIEGGVLEKECSELLTVFFRKKVSRYLPLSFVFCLIKYIQVDIFIILRAGKTKRFVCINQNIIKQ